MFEDYNKTLHIARELYLKLFDEPTSHEEWAESFNKIGEINEVIMNGTKTEG